MSNNLPVGVSFSDPNLTTGWGINGTAVTSSATELNIMTGVTATTAELNKIDGVPYSVTLVNTPGASGVTEAALTFKDAAGVTIAIPVYLPFFLSSSTGLAITAAITSILPAATPVGAVGATVTGQQGFVVTTAAGLASVKLTGTAATAYYLTFLTTGGRLITTAAITTAA